MYFLENTGLFDNDHRRVLRPQSSRYFASAQDSTVFISRVGRIINVAMHQFQFFVILVTMLPFLIAILLRDDGNVFVSAGSKNFLFQFF